MKRIFVPGSIRTHDLRAFDGREVARLETATWRSYYDHHPAYLFAELTGSLRKQYGFPFWRSVLGAYYAAHAAGVFQPGRERVAYGSVLNVTKRNHRPDATHVS